MDAEGVDDGVGGCGELDEGGGAAIAGPAGSGDKVRMVEEAALVGTVKDLDSDEDDEAALVATILTAAARFFVLKMLLPVLLLRRTGALGPEMRTVAVMRVWRPVVAVVKEAVDGDEDDDVADIFLRAVVAAAA